MKLGILGLPNVGKSTLFNALTQAGATANNYAFSTIKPNTGMVHVPDERLTKLSAMYHPKKTTPAMVEFVDITGLVKGASRGEGLGNKFLSHIRECEAMVQVVRAFVDPNVQHVDERIEPMSDIQTIALELIFADMDTLERQLDRAQKMVKTGDPKYKEAADLCARMIQHLSEEKPARTFPFAGLERAMADDWFLLTMKPTLYVLNIGESQIGLPDEEIPGCKEARQLAASEDALLIVLCARTEEELAALPDDEKAEFLEALGLPQLGREQLIQASYALLGLISFLTAGADECRSWTIQKGTKAPQAAGKIHSDLERGFIRAEIVAFDALMAHGTMAACKELGLVRAEGRDYVMKDGDVTQIRFHV